MFYPLATCQKYEQHGAYVLALTSSLLVTKLYNTRSKEKNKEKNKKIF